MTTSITKEEEEEQKAYIAQLSPMEKKVLEIAKSHLESSFSLEKSIGFQNWKNSISKAISNKQ
jgi:hypothetical protein